jgi:hypothetical protein
MSAHGTRSRYVDGCRCQACTAANTAYHAGRKAQRRAWVEANGLPSTVEHGYSAYVNWGCRCDVCGPAHSTHWREWHEVADS